MYARARGLLRSLAIYHGVPWRAAQLRRFYAPLVPAGALAFDVGAHAGNRVRALRALGARVVAVEPQPDFVRVLHAMFAGDDAVTVLPLALGRAPGRVQLLQSDATPTVATLAPDWARRVAATPSFARVRWRAGAWVEVDTLDALIERHGRPDFVKIDVEGYEAEVLHGLTVPIAALSFEFVPAAIDVALACVDRLEQLARYRYNASFGERLRLVHANDLDARGVRCWLAALDTAADSGDVIARRA